MISTPQIEKGEQRNEGATSWPEDPNNPAITSTQYINHQMSLVKTVQKSNRTQLPSRNNFDVTLVDGKLLFDNEKKDHKPNAQAKSRKKSRKMGKRLSS